MKRNFKITESQYEYLMSGNYQMMEEGTVVSDSNPSNTSVTVCATNQPKNMNLTDKLKNAANLAAKHNIDVNKPGVDVGAEAEINGKPVDVTASSENVQEGRILSKEDIMRMRRDFLRENSREINFKKFLKNL